MAEAGDVNLKAARSVPVRALRFALHMVVGGVARPKAVLEVHLLKLFSVFRTVAGGAVSFKGALKLRKGNLRSALRTEEGHDASSRVAPRAFEMPGGFLVFVRFIATRHACPFIQ